MIEQETLDRLLELTLIQQVNLAIVTLLKACPDKENFIKANRHWNEWAAKWLSGEDRTPESAKQCFSLSLNAVNKTTTQSELNAVRASAYASEAARMFALNEIPGEITFLCANSLQDTIAFGYKFGSYFRPPGENLINFKEIFDKVKETEYV